MLTKISLLNLRVRPRIHTQEGKKRTMNKTPISSSLISLWLV